MSGRHITYTYREEGSMFRSVIIGLLSVVAVLILPPSAKAEYADVVINNYADAAGMRPVVFPHWYHRIRFRCKVCHADLGFEFKAGGNKITMAKIIDGQFCGACHNGEISWSVENCGMCHSGIPGTPTSIHGSTVQRLVAPTYKALEEKEKAKEKEKETEKQKEKVPQK
ncbi:MAG TPA: c(7)-type cytochrome triheme domain-containing protein [Gammaproteobacteria bacterium]